MLMMILFTISQCAKMTPLLLTYVSRLTNIISDERAHEIGEILYFFRLLLRLAFWGSDRFMRTSLAVSIWRSSCRVVRISSRARGTP